MCVCARICVYIHICCLFVSNSIIISAYYHAYVRICINVYVTIHINYAQTHFYLLFIFTNVDMCNQFHHFQATNVSSFLQDFDSETTFLDLVVAAEPPPFGR